MRMRSHTKLIQTDSEIIWSGMKLKVDFLSPFPPERGNLSPLETFTPMIARVLDHNSMTVAVVPINPCYTMYNNDTLILTFRRVKS